MEQKGRSETLTTTAGRIRITATNIGTRRMCLTRMMDAYRDGFARGYQVVAKELMGYSGRR